MTSIFLRQEQANEYVKSIQEREERVFTDAALCRAIGFLMLDEDYKARFSSNPLDLLIYVRTVHALVKNRKLVDEALSGKYENFDDIPNLF